MLSVTNKTRKPLSIPLPRGKTLHLGPGKSAEITSNSAEHPQLKKLVDAGEIEISTAGSRTEGIGGGNKGHASTAYGSRLNRRGSGDR